MANPIEIPLKNSNEVIEIQLCKMPEYNEVLEILKLEHVNLSLWIDLALEYYKRGNSTALVSLLESSNINANLEYEDSDKDKMRALDMLAAYYVQTAIREKNNDNRRELIRKATVIYTTADNSNMYDTNHLLARAFFCLLDDEKINQADTQFNYILDQSPNNMLAQLGKAYISFNNKDYTEALAYYKKILRSNPKCPIGVRLGLANCFLKLGNTEKARLAFERTLELDSKCMEALVGLAIMKLNCGNPSGIKLGVNMLSEAYTIDTTNPMVLNHLSNHFFFKKDYTKSELLASLAFDNTENEAMRAESCYHMAKTFHVQNKYDQAFQYYYQATQFASDSFVLPHYGLGQMYLYGGEMENAAQCFEKVLKAQPENYETMKILGYLYANSKNKIKQDIGKIYLKKVTKNFPEDVESWIELAQILEQSDIQASLSAYVKAMDLMCNVPPEILNNVAALNYRLGNLDESRSQLEKSLSLTMEMIKDDPDYYHSVAVTTTYNLARIIEEQCQYQQAETFYKNILKEHPSYLRLGCMARNRNQIYEASDWFKEALRIDIIHPDAWSLLGNLHLNKMEWGAGQKKFKHVLKNPSSSNDSYALIAMGNIWLQMLHIQPRNKELDKRNLELALKFFTEVLQNDDKNIWASNGIGCVLAHQNYINEAKIIFHEVREATNDFCDVWLNIAHIYIEQKQYISGIQIYKNCIKKFFKHDNVEVLQYLGRAYFIAGKFNEAKTVFLKARRVAPQDMVILYNIAIVLQKLAVQILENEKSKLKDVLKAVYELELSQKYFQYLSVHGDRMIHNISLTEIEAKYCQDLLSQAQYHVARARKIDNDEHEIRRKNEEKREEFRLKQINEKNKALEQQQKHKNEMMLKRQEYIEKTKNALVFNHGRKKPTMKKISLKNYGSDSGRSIDSKPCVNKSSRLSKLNKSRRSDGDTETNKNGRYKRRKVSIASGGSAGSEKPVSKKQRSKLKVISKAIISTSEDDSVSDSEVNKRISRHLESCSKSETHKSRNESHSVSSSQSQSGSRSHSGSSSSSFSRSHSGSSSSLFSRSHSGNSSSPRSRSKTDIQSRSRSTSSSKSRSRSLSISKSTSISPTRSKSGSRSASNSLVHSGSRSTSNSPTRSRSSNRSSTRNRKFQLYQKI